MADHRALIQSFVDMINDHDISRMSEHTAPGHIDHNPRGRGRHRGQHRVLEADIRRVPGHQDRRARRDLGRRPRLRALRVLGHPPGAFFGVEATGRTLTFQSIDIWRVENGLLAEHWDQLDMGGMFHQLGVDFYAMQGAGA